MKKRRGFSLIELLMVLAILGILVGFAYPSYLDQIKKSRRSDATKALLKAAALQERWFLQHSSYATNNQIAYVGGDMSEAGYYKLSIDTPECGSGSGGVGDLDSACLKYTLTAEAIESLSQGSDHQCLTFSLDQAGQKTATTDTCW